MVGFLFITEIGVQIYINYRKYPPTSICLTTLHGIKDYDYFEESIERMAAYEWLFN